MSICIDNLLCADSHIILSLINLKIKILCLSFQWIQFVELNSATEFRRFSISV